ncbi:SDR family NAD(P)-dependent oxidoreductase [Mycolicibacterium sp. 050232]|uniref:SDR family NAD(P)-dependent oxidoreductase n=1 Tax=Mycolicibacterium sp. 050232 TaxID=3113982 RepID=UPI002E2CC701|nr:SDR family NAD(P)-dependent oxidoreductase [Mycolicibacterium sp. 050232]MED5811069.1 SDR family NAD(P)-dependent oxidoreductase [Mycolicibacterium sp. 050232]
MRIDGAQAVVTGAAGGLGGAIARALLARGARLILTDVRAEPLHILAAECDGAEVLVCDLSDRGELGHLAARCGGADIVVANAALPATGKIDDFTARQLDRALDVNLGLSANPGSKGVTSDFVARRVVNAIEKDRAEVDAAELPVRIVARLAGLAPGLTARLTRRGDAIAWSDRVSEGLRHLR